MDLLVPVGFPGSQVSLRFTMPSADRVESVQLADSEWRDPPDPAFFFGEVTPTKQGP